MLSKNSASSRAIPFKKMVQMVQENPFIPLRWQKDHSGMQGTEYWEGELMHARHWEIDGKFPTVKHVMELQWLKARDHAVDQAAWLNAEGLTKQLCNRLLEPFAWHTVLLTGTEFENFFALRASPHAEIHMAHLAELMLEAYNNAEVKQLQPGEWHMPFGDKIDFSDNFFAAVSSEEQQTIHFLKICTARCAQTSYTLFGDNEKPMGIVKLIGLHDKLATSGHWSPFEHCARAMSKDECVYSQHTERIDGAQTKLIPAVSGNFRGFIQYRKMFPNENQSDKRVKH